MQVALSLFFFVNPRQPIKPGKVLEKYLRVLPVLWYLKFFLVLCPAPPHSRSFFLLTADPLSNEKETKSHRSEAATMVLPLASVPIGPIVDLLWTIAARLSRASPSATTTERPAVGEPATQFFVCFVLFFFFRPLPLAAAVCADSFSQIGDRFARVRNSGDSTER